MLRSLILICIAITGLFFSHEAAGFSEWHDANKLLLQIARNGVIGGVSAIPESVPGLAYPYPCNVFYCDYLRKGSIWLGGIVNAESVVIGSDDLCTNGVNGTSYWWRTTEWVTQVGFPYAQLYYTVYADSVTGVEVQQKSYAFYYPASYMDFIIFDLKIANLGSLTFENVYLGVFFDGMPCCGWYVKERCGVRILPNEPSGDTAYIGWVAEDDGNPVKGKFNENSPTSVVGVKILYPRPGDCQTSFNWWSYKWGPTLQSNFDEFGYMTDSSLGQATTCREKYYLMSNGEIDYDQNLTHLDHTADGWLPPPTNGIDIARGACSIFLLSCGPVGNLLPGDTMRFAFAVIGAEDFHTNTLYDTLFPEYTFYDFANLENNALIAQRLYDSLFNPPPDVKEGPLPVPRQFRLEQNYPNPFNALTRISYALPKLTDVRIDIFNLLGQKVKTFDLGLQSAGLHSVFWDGEGEDAKTVSSGIYFYRIKAGDFVQTKKMTFLK